MQDSEQKLFYGMTLPIIINFLFTNFNHIKLSLTTRLPSKFIKWNGRRHFGNFLIFPQSIQHSIRRSSDAA